MIEHDEPIVRCDLAEGTWCIGMDMYLQEANAHKKGLAPLLTIRRFDDGTGWKMEEKVRGVVYKGSASDRGLLLNRCPWCGHWLNSFEEEFE